MLYLAVDLNYTSEETFANLYQKLDVILSGTYKLIKYLESMHTYKSTNQ